MEDQINYLEKVQRIVYKDILVTENILKDNIYVPTFRVPIMNNTQIIDHRTIASNEIIFDLDFKSYNLVYRYGKAIERVLIERKIPYYIFSTGGKGIHIHIFFDKIEFTVPEIKKLFEEALSYNFSWKDIRQFIFTSICLEAEIPRDYIGKYIDTQKILFDELDNSTVLIRCCGGRNQKFDSNNVITTYKSWIPNEDFKEKKILIKNIAKVKYPDEVKPFQINQYELGTCLRDYINIAKANKTESFQQINLPEGYMGLSSIKKLMEGMPEGQRNQGAKILALALTLDKVDRKKAEMIMAEYAENCSQIGHLFSKSEAINWLRWMDKQPTHFWNNNYIKKLGIYDRDTDEYEKISNKGCQLLYDKNLLKIIDNYLSNEIVGEEENRMLIFLLTLSSKFKVHKDWNITGDPQPQSIILSSLSASGKSYMTKSITKLFGEEGIDWYCYSRMTSSVLNYFTDVDMTNKILFIEELQGTDEDSNQLRLWISEGKLKLATVEKNADDVNDIAFRESIGQPVFISGTAEDKIGEQLNNRSWLISLDISKEQNEAILEYQGKIVQKTRYHNDNELRVIQEALKELKPYHFIIPFFDYKMLNIPSNDVRIRRDYKKFGNLICCSALLHQKQREIVKDNLNNEYIVANLEDYEIAVKYSTKVLISTFSGLTAQQIILFERIKSQSWADEFEIAEVQRLTNWGYMKCYNVLKQLEETGIVTTSGRKTSHQTIYSINKMKKLTSLFLPSKEELLERVLKN